MYGKLFESMYDGTLADDWEALVTFQQMIILCDADGVIDMTEGALSRRTGIPLEYIKIGIKVLESTDESSRTDGENGRRIKRLDEHRSWGWFIVNHNKYRGLQDSDTVREQNRERKRRQRERESQDVTPGHACHTMSRHTDTDTDTDTDTKKKKTKKKKFEIPSIEEVNAYCIERKNGIDPEKWWHSYNAKDWMIGKSKMKSWKSAVITWEKNETQGQTKQSSGRKTYDDYIDNLNSKSGGVVIDGKLD